MSLAKSSVNILVLSLRAELNQETTRKAGQTSRNMPNQPPPQDVAEDEPRVELEEGEMDVETLRTTLIVLQEELANLRANQENVAETMLM